MTVAELIEKLKALPQDKDVVMRDDRGYHIDVCGADVVEVEPEPDSGPHEVVAIWW